MKEIKMGNIVLCRLIQASDMIDPELSAAITLISLTIYFDFLKKGVQRLTFLANRR